MPEEKDTSKKAAASASEKNSTKVAIIRIRGSINTVSEIEDTLDMLRLYKKNNCVIIELTPSVKGMIKKVDNFVTWGEVDDETLSALKKKGEKMPYRLNPPVKGYGRKGIKVPFKKGGALGYRADKINGLIQRMI